MNYTHNKKMLTERARRLVENGVLSSLTCDETSRARSMRGACRHGQVITLWQESDETQLEYLEDPAQPRNPWTRVRAVRSVISWIEYRFDSGELSRERRDGLCAVCGRCDAEEVDHYRELVGLPSRRGRR